MFSMIYLEKRIIIKNNTLTQVIYHSYCIFTVALEFAVPVVTVSPVRI